MSCINCPLSDFLDSYTRAFDNKDMNALLEHYYYPCLLTTGQSVIACKNKEEMHDVIKHSSRFISGGNIEHKTSYTLTSLYPLEDNNQIISLIWRVNNRLGQEVSKFHTNYHLIKDKETYKIIVIMLPEENF